MELSSLALKIHICCALGTLRHALYLLSFIAGDFATRVLRPLRNNSRSRLYGQALTLHGWAAES
jgi:hypothetical protein